MNTTNVCFEFVGGALDGKRVWDGSPKPRDARLARFLRVATKGGAPGRWFRGMSDDLLSERERERFSAEEFATLEFEVTGQAEDSELTVVQIRQRQP